MKLCVDASALLAVFLKEPDRDEILERLMMSTQLVMSPVNYWEALVRARAIKGDIGMGELEKLASGLEIVITPVTVGHARMAADAAARFGKPHKARLNLGDCFAYALAVSEKAPLVFKGGDFPQTDVPQAPAR